MRSLPIARPWLYEAWNRFGRPRVEGACGPVDVCHSTVAIPAATRAAQVVTVHDVAFVHTPERFTAHGVRVMRAGLERCRRADRLIVPSAATRDDLAELGFDPARIRTVPWGVDPTPAAEAEVERVRRHHGLPDRFVLFVGTVEPRKNLSRLTAAVARLPEPVPLVVAGAEGWGERPEVTGDVRFLGFVPAADLAPLYRAATVAAYPSLQEGFGLPVLEAMAQGTAVVTSAATATAETAGGAAVLVDPTDVEAIADGLARALDDPSAWSAPGLARAAAMSWDATADATLGVYRELVR